MALLAVFIVTILVGDLAVGIASVIERFSEGVSLFVFLAWFIGLIPVAWRIAVRLTEPKAATTR